jgi:DNA-binding LacI/PurR family transcriptional regulator
VIGIDDHEMAEYFELSTVAQPVHEIGRISAQLLLEALDCPNGEPEPPRQVTVPTQLVVRSTTAPPRD